MWSREFLKNRAKAVLKVSYWNAFFVSIVLAIFGGSDNYFNFNWNSGNQNSSPSFSFFSKPVTDLFPFLILITLGSVIIVLVFAFAFRVFLGYPLEIGGKRYFVQSAQNNINMNNLGYGFNNGYYFNIVKTMLYKSVLTFLWTLLLIIPGIVKSYAYRMVPYILSDNPSMEYNRALELSVKMTDGEKLNMWVLDLSFIGWYLLGRLLFFVGVIFVFPYENATKAELYLVLRKHALDEGICTYEELKLF